MKNKLFKLSFVVFLILVGTSYIFAQGYLATTSYPSVKTIRVWVRAGGAPAATDSSSYGYDSTTYTVTSRSGETVSGNPFRVTYKTAVTDTNKTLFTSADSLSSAGGYIGFAPTMNKSFNAGDTIMLFFASKVNTRGGALAGWTTTARGRLQFDTSLGVTAKANKSDTLKMAIRYWPGGVTTSGSTKDTNAPVFVLQNAACGFNGNVGVRAPTDSAYY